MSAQPNLYVVGGHAVDGDTGELVTIAGLQTEVATLKAENAKMSAELKGALRDLRAWRIRYRQLEEDKAEEAREHPCWPVGGHLCIAWRKMCNHPRSPWEPKRFWACEPFLCSSCYGETLTLRVELCARAIKGAQFDPWTKPRKNGTVWKGDDWEAIFKSPGRFEDFCNRAPLQWQPKLGPKMLAAIETAEALLERQRQAKKGRR